MFLALQVPTKLILHREAQAPVDFWTLPIREHSTIYEKVDRCTIDGLTAISDSLVIFASAAADVCAVIIRKLR
jgi:hypothetical protein